MIEKETATDVEEEIFYDCEISWEEFNDIKNPKISVGFSTTVSESMAMELAIPNPNGEGSESLFIFNPNARETVLRTVGRINKEAPNSQEIVEVSGVFFTEFLVRWSSQQSQQQ